MESVLSTFSNFKAAMAHLESTNKPPPPPRRDFRLPKNKTEKVHEGDISRKPIDRTAAFVVSKAPWWATVIPPVISKHKPKKINKSKNMKTPLNETSSGQADVGQGRIRTKVVNGELLYDTDDIRILVIQEVERLPKETRPILKAAEDAREAMAVLTDGMGALMEKFKIDVKLYLEDIRSSRYAVTTEVSQMMNGLKDVRQFFMGTDHKEQVDRLRAFVELCERLKALKDSGFLDAVADTIIKLDR